MKGFDYSKIAYTQNLGTNIIENITIRVETNLNLETEFHTLYGQIENQANKQK